MSVSLRIELSITYSRQSCGLHYLRMSVKRFLQTYRLQMHVLSNRQLYACVACNAGG